ncbi:hypothetical protein EYF80_065116 [Liparis tanakae]|uniref:Uncharacterized protein n=1 Tax=Liparis tanakae TaxID=230148 RepID=A0A4Z2E7G9_9TELE|nr:hypothetical protein EYF80_065116 [Liparis tanakae]
MTLITQVRATRRPAGSHGPRRETGQTVWTAKEGRQNQNQSRPRQNQTEPNRTRQNQTEPDRTRQNQTCFSLNEIKR